MTQKSYEDGDPISIRVGHHVSAYNGKHTYIEYQGTVHVGPGETMDQAHNRLISNVVDGLTEATETYIDSQETHNIARQGVHRD